MATISNYIVGVIIFTLIMVGGIAMITEFVKEDSSFIDTGRFSKFNKTFNKYTELQSGVSGLKSGVDGSADSDFGVFGVLNGLINTAWNTVTTIFTSFSFMDSSIAGVNEFIGIPTWMLALITSIISIIIIFAIIGAIFQRDI